MKKVLGILFVIVVASFTVRAVNADDKLKIVATLSSYSDIAKSVGGDCVEASYVASPKFDPHFIEPKPSDILRLKRADLFIHSGLDLEAWREPLVDAAARADIRSGGERQLDLSRGIRILNVPTHNVSRAEGDIHLYGNPHYWLDPRNGLIIADEIAAKLSELDPARATTYQTNLAKFKSALQAKIQQWQQALAPFAGTRLVGYHDGWVYLMKFAGFKMEMFLEPKPGIPPTPKQIEGVIAYVKRARVPAIVQSSHSSTDAAESVAAATGAKVLTLSQEVGDGSSANDFIAMFDYDVAQFLEVLSQHA